MNSFIALSRAGTAPADTRFSPADLGPADPFARHRHVAWTGADNMSVGRVTWSGSATLDAFPHTELIMVTQGELHLENAETMLRVVAGEVAVAGRGSSFSIRANAGASWVFCAVSAATPVPLLQAVNLAAELTASPPPGADVLLSPEPQCRSYPVFADNPARTRIGLWDSTPYTRKRVPHRVNELMYILEGHVTLSDASGRAVSFGPGDCVFVPHQTPCAWQSDVHVRKLYCVQDFDA